MNFILNDHDWDLTFCAGDDVFAVEAEVEAGEEATVAAEGGGEPRVRERVLRVLLLLPLPALLLPASRSVSASSPRRCSSALSRLHQIVLMG